MNQEFIFQEFKKLKRHSDLRKYSLKRVQLYRLLSSLELQLKNPDYNFSSLTLTKINNKDVFYIDTKHPTSVFDEFVLRKIDYNLKKIFSIK